MIKVYLKSPPSFGTQCTQKQEFALWQLYYTPLVGYLLPLYHIIVSCLLCGSLKKSVQCKQILIDFSCSWCDHYQSVGVVQCAQKRKLIIWTWHEGIMFLKKPQFFHTYSKHCKHVTTQKIAVYSTMVLLTIAIQY